MIDRSRSEFVLHGKLHNPRIPGRINLAKSPIVDTSVRVTQIDVVRQVKNLGSELERLVLRDVKRSSQADVERKDSRTLDAVAAKVPVGACRRCGEGVRPVWKISTPLGARAAQTGLVLDPVHEEVIVATGAGNQILVFHVPEIFAERSEAPRASTPIRFSAEE